MTNDNMPLNTNINASNLEASASHAAEGEIKHATAEGGRNVVAFEQMRHHFRHRDGTAQCYTATIAVAAKAGAANDGYPLALDLRTGFGPVNGAMSCLRKMLELLANPDHCPPSMLMTGKSTVDVLVEPDWLENIYFTSVVEAGGGYVLNRPAPRFRGPAERCLAYVAHFLERHGPVVPLEAEAILLAQLRTKWHQRMLAQEGWCVASMWKQQAASTVGGYLTRLHSIAYIGSPLQRSVAYDGMVKVLGKTYQSELTKALAGGRRKNVRQTFYVNPWDDRAIYMLDRQRKQFVEVPRVNNLLRILGIRPSEIEVRWPGNVEKLMGRGALRPD